MVVSRGKRVSEHHHGGVDDDLLAVSARGRDLSPAPATVQPQSELSAVTVQLHLVPIAVAEMLVWERQVIVSVSEVVKNSQQTLNHLRKHRRAFLFHKAGIRTKRTEQRRLKHSNAHMKEFGDTTVNPNILIKFLIVVSRSGFQSFEKLSWNKI